jgi:selenocysteine lyase/cysteine desulfurase
MYTHLYQKFLNGHQGKIHMCAHSHHFWPDVSFLAQEEAWLDASKFSDHKWAKVFGEIIPANQKIIADILNLSHPQNIAFAPNTHELLSRLLSCFLGQEKINILTTTNEFHSFKRQIERLEEFNQVKVTKIDNGQAGFEENFLQSIDPQIDLIFLSQVFFNSSKVNSHHFIEKIIKTKSAKTLFCLDGYHGFCAIPTDLKPFENELFYLAGGYKYAQAGEGMCFMTIPDKCQLRPSYTGWFADFAGLEKQTKQINYAKDGFRFWGSTQDPTPFYRFKAVWERFEQEKISIKIIHEYVRTLQRQFLDSTNLTHLLVESDLSKLGHFLTLDLKTNEQAELFHRLLLEENVMTDFRNQFLRFGFGLYQTPENIKKLAQILNGKKFHIF